MTKKDFFKEELSATERKHRIALAKAVVGLVKSKKPSQLPDYAGEFLSRTTRMLVEALFADDLDLFSDAFPYLFQSSIAKSVLLVTAVSPDGSDQFQKFVTGTTPLVDLMEVSGFAILVSEMEQSAGPWNLAERLWNLYLTDREAGAVRINVLKGAMQACDMAMMIPPGELARTEWRRRASDWVARRLGLNPNVARGFLGGDGGQKVAHSSALVRVLARDTLLGMYRGTDIFGAMYFSKLPGATLDEGGFRFNNLVDSLAMESRRDETGNLDEEEDFDGPNQI